MNARAIDHLVLPVKDLAATRARLGDLGFTVAPDALHPFGTANACVFLRDGSYLEPLAFGNRRQAAAAAKRGNVFTERNLAFCRTRHREGLSAIVLATDDAEADHAAFKAQGISGGEMLEFARPMKLPDGTESEARFRLAFAADSQSPDFFLFSCQRLNPLPSGREELLSHANAVIGISEIILGASQPDAAVPLLAQVFEHERDELGAGFVAASGVRTRVMSDDDLGLHFLLPPQAGGQGLQGCAVIFKTADLAVTEITLAANDVAFIRREGRVLVSAAPGQGVLFGFEE